MRIIYLLLPALLLGNVLPAQNKYFVKGIIITKAGDTVSGFIERVRDNVLAEGITFKKDLDNKDVQKYTPDDLLSFILPEENRIYEPVTYKSLQNNATTYEKRFANLLVRGYCSLYSMELKEDEINIIFEPGNTNIYFAKKLDSVTVLRETESIINSIYRLDKSYVDELQTLFSDCPSIDSETIASTHFYRKAMVAIFIEYDLCKKPHTPPTVFKNSEKPKIKTTVYLGYPLFVYNDASNSSGISGGFFINIINPRINERLALSIGINVTHIRYDIFLSETNYRENDTYTFYALPIRAVYYLNKKKIVPFISFGATPSLYKLKFYDNMGQYTQRNWIVFGSFGSGVNIGNIYFEALAEMKGFFTIKEGTYFNFRIGYTF